MKTFKDLQVGDKIYIGFCASFVHEIKYINGYLTIYTYSNKIKPSYIVGTPYCIPLNHLEANNVKVGGRHIFISESRYKKYIMDFMNSQLKK